MPQTQKLIYEVRKMLRMRKAVLSSLHSSSHFPSHYSLTSRLISQHCTSFHFISLLPGGKWRHNIKKMDFDHFTTQLVSFLSYFVSFRSSHVVREAYIHRGAIFTPISPLVQAYGIVFTPLCVRVCRGCA